MELKCFNNTCNIRDNCIHQYTSPAFTENKYEYDVTDGCAYYVEKYESNEEPNEVVYIDLDNEILLSLALQAHELDITLNDYINQILKKYIEEYHDGV